MEEWAAERNSERVLNIVSEEDTTILTYVTLFYDHMTTYSNYQNLTFEFQLVDLPLFPPLSPPPRRSIKGRGPPPDRYPNIGHTQSAQDPKVLDPVAAASWSCWWNRSLKGQPRRNLKAHRPHSRSARNEFLEAKEFKFKGTRACTRVVALDGGHKATSS